MARRSKGSRGSRIGRILFLLALAAVLFVWIWNQFGIVRVIQVDGVSSEEAVSIASACGVSSGMKLADVEEDHVADMLRPLPDFAFLGLEKQEPDTLILHMRKRTPCALASCAGNQYVLDEYCHVMERRNGGDSGDLLSVLGLIVNGATVGSELETVDQNQVRAVSAVLRALVETGALSYAGVLNVNDLDNLYIMSTIGVKVELGDSQNMSDKCVWMMSVLHSLQMDGASGGILDVSSGTRGIYRP